MSIYGACSPFCDPRQHIGAHLLAGSGALAPNTMGLTFEALAQVGVLPADLALNLKKAVGFRNIAVHNCDAINWHIVHSIVTDHLTDFSAFAEILSQKLHQPWPIAPRP